MEGVSRADLIPDHAVAPSTDPDSDPAVEGLI
jgi:hypothetical protein